MIALARIDSALHVARKVFDTDPQAGTLYLDSRGEVLALCPAGPFWVDAESFEEAAAIARREGEPAAYWAALDLYAGELFPEDLYEAWTEDRRR